MRLTRTAKPFGLTGGVPGYARRCHSTYARYSVHVSTDAHFPGRMSLSWRNSHSSSELEPLLIGGRGGGGSASSARSASTSFTAPPLVDGCDDLIFRMTTGGLFRFLTEQIVGDVVAYTGEGEWILVPAQTLVRSVALPQELDGMNLRLG